MKRSTSRGLDLPGDQDRRAEQIPVPGGYRRSLIGALSTRHAAGFLDLSPPVLYFPQNDKDVNYRLANIQIPATSKKGTTTKNGTSKK